jgi:hypothetical protein
MFRNIVLLVGALAPLCSVSLFAQDAALTQQYGSGVHAYFTGDTMNAYQRLTAVIERGSKDPRAYYFRGLTYLKLGRPQEAAADFRMGADLESKDVNRFYNVGKALERVQGAERLELENYRVDARMAALEEAEKVRKLRYEAIQREEERVVREQAAVAPEKPIDSDETARTAADSSSDPFAVPDSATKKAGKTVDSGNDPFAVPAKSAAKKSEKKGGATGKAAEKAAGKKPAPTKKPGDEDNDPFKNEPNGKKKADDEKKPADDSDPFKNEPSGAKKKAGTDKPAKPAGKKADSADPFAE